MKILFKEGALSDAEQAFVNAGFRDTAIRRSAPPYNKHPFCWLLEDDQGALQGVLTADQLWDWLYFDELWIDAAYRGQGLGRQLIHDAESWARGRNLVGIWLWTQSWEAEGFYRQLGFEVFTRFENFPRGHQRIGLRKSLQS